MTISGKLYQFSTVIVAIFIGLSVTFGLLVRQEVIDYQNRPPLFEAIDGHYIGDWWNSALKKDPAAVKPLSRFLNSRSEVDRVNACQLLGIIGIDSEPTVPKLVELLDDPRAEVRKAALGALIMIGPAADLALPDLVRHQNDEDGEVRKLVASAIELITCDFVLRGWKESVDYAWLDAALRDKDPLKRCVAMRIIQISVFFRGDWLSLIVNFCSDKRPFIGRMAARTLCIVVGRRILSV
jgi:hypothetical protein